MPVFQNKVVDLKSRFIFVTFWGPKITIFITIGQELLNTIEVKILGDTHRQTHADTYTPMKLIPEKTLFWARQSLPTTNSLLTPRSQNDSSGAFDTTTIYPSVAVDNNGVCGGCK